MLKGILLESKEERHEGCSGIAQLDKSCAWQSLLKALTLPRAAAAGLCAQLPMKYMTFCMRVRIQPDSQLQAPSGIWEKMHRYQALNRNNIQKKYHQHNYSTKLRTTILLHYADVKNIFTFITGWGEKTYTLPCLPDRKFSEHGQAQCSFPRGVKSQAAVYLAFQHYTTNPSVILQTWEEQETHNLSKQTWK